MTSDSLFLADGRPRLGVFEDAVSVDIDAYRHRDVFGKPSGALARWLGYKRFQYFGVISDELLLGCAVAHLRHTVAVFAYVYRRGEGLVFERSARIPLGFGTQLSDSPLSGRSKVRFGALQMEMGYRAAPRVKSLDLRWGDALVVQAEMDETAAGFQPMSICTRIGRNGWVYAHKVAGVGVTGAVRIADSEVDLASIDGFGHHDFSAGYMRRETFWNWACLSGRVATGQRVGLNVSCGVNETSFSENCLWVDGRLVPVGLCTFEYDWARPLDSWLVRSGDGAVDLRFDPEGQHAERLRLGVAASDFKQIFGTFSGRLRLPDDQELAVDGLNGFVEDQYAKW